MEELIKELPKGLIKWYDFEQGTHALFVRDNAGKFDVISDALRECGLCVDSISLEELEEKKTADGSSENKYHYIVMIGVLEWSKNPQKILNTLRSLLKPCGKLLMGTDNRLGVRYFCGDRDLFTERSFDGIENYVRVYPLDRTRLKGRAYAKAEIISFLENAGFEKYKMFSVLPALERPQALYGEDYLPEEQLDIRITPQYYHPDTVFLEEENLYDSLMKNGLFHAMANGYLFECTIEGCLSQADQVTLSMDRGEENAFATVIYQNDKVIKKALYTEGQNKLKTLIENLADLKRHEIETVDAKIENDVFVMPYVEGTNATDYFRNLLLSDKNAFLEKMDEFWELILHSSEHVPYEEVDWEHFDPEWEKQKADYSNKDKWKKLALGSQKNQEEIGVILKRGYIDLVSLNCLYRKNKFVFYDQEFYIEHLPANVILLRTIYLIYSGKAQLEAILPLKKLLARYHLDRQLDLWERFVRIFLMKLRNESSLFQYHQMYRRDIGTVNANRQRMNYSVSEYERLFRNIFKGTEGRQIYLFGSGRFTEHFLSQFGQDYEITGILDNDKEKWGKEMSGIRIMEPEHLRSLQMDSYKVIICVKHYMSIMKQLQEMGVKDYAVYDRSLTYPRKESVNVIKMDDGEPKKYHVGYVAGVFDLFHIGHLNLLKRAKEQCDYLIVGVVNDEGVMNNKKTMPCIPFEERIELVRACRYVDEAVEIPAKYNETKEAYRRYQFDVQFSGSDYENDPWWLSKKAFLQSQGADLVFFPYTESTSSSKLKKLIEQKLI